MLLIIIAALQQLTLHRHYNAMMMVDVFIMKTNEATKEKNYMKL
jgi:hypothetical protein